MADKFKPIGEFTPEELNQINPPTGRNPCRCVNGHVPECYQSNEEDTNEDH